MILYPLPVVQNSIKKRKIEHHWTYFFLSSRHLHKGIIIFLKTFWPWLCMYLWTYFIRQFHWTPLSLWSTTSHMSLLPSLQFHPTTTAFSAPRVWQRFSYFSIKMYATRPSLWENEHLHSRINPCKIKCIGLIPSKTNTFTLNAVRLTNNSDFSA